MPQFIFTELPIHVKTEQHAPTVCSHLTFKPVVFVFQWGLLKKQDLLNPKNKKKSKTKARCQRLTNLQELRELPTVLKYEWALCSSRAHNEPLPAFLDRPSEQHSSGRIKHEFRDWENHFYTVWVGYCCRGDVISAVQCEQSFIDRNTTRCFTVCPLPQHSGNNFGCLAFPFACGKTVSVLLFCGLRSLESYELSEGYTSFFLDLYIYIVPLTGFKGLKCSDSRQD